MITRDEVLNRAIKESFEVTLFQEGAKTFKLSMKSSITKFKVEEDNRVIYIGEDVNRAVTLFNNSGIESQFFFRLQNVDRKSTPGFREVFNDGYLLNGAFVRRKSFTPIGVVNYRVIFATGQTFDLTRTGQGPEVEYSYVSPSLAGFDEIKIAEAMQLFEECAKFETPDSYRLDSAIEETQQSWEQ